MRSVLRNELIDVGEVIQNGIVFNLWNWQDESVNMENLPETVARLFGLLQERKIEYVLVGGVAMLQYVEGRNTQDIDLILAPEALEQLSEVELTARQENFARARFEGVRVDFLFTNHALFKQVLESYSEMRPFKDRKIRCASLEGMLLLKLYALPSLYRQGRLARAAIYESDIAGLMLASGKSMDGLFEVLKSHLSSSDLQEIRKIVVEIQQHAARFGQGAGPE